MKSRWLQKSLTVAIPIDWKSFQGKNFDFVGKNYGALDQDYFKYSELSFY